MIAENFSRYMQFHKTFISRFVVLNKLALLVYRDEATFRETPQKPDMVFPLHEILEVSSLQNQTRESLATHVNGQVSQNIGSDNNIGQINS